MSAVEHDTVRAAWSRRLPAGTGRSVWAGVWLIPAVTAAGVLAGLVLRWWPW